MAHDQKESEKIAAEIQDILNELEKTSPGATAGLAAALGAGAGAGIGFAGLVFGGSVTGLSAAGITSGLAAAGGIVGGGMAAGIFVLAAPIAIFGVLGYAIAASKKKAQLCAALSTAISKLDAVQRRLLKNAEYYQEEIATIKAILAHLHNKKQAQS